MRHHLTARRIGEATALGVWERDGEVEAALLAGFDVARLRQEIGDDVVLRPGAGGVIARLGAGRMVADDRGDIALEGRRVLVAFRSGETGAELGDWFDWNRKSTGADAALILTAGVPDATFVSHAEALAGCEGAKVALVSVDVARIPGIAVHAAVALYLAVARSAAWLSLSDLVLPGDGPPLLERAEDAAGRVVALSGEQAWPWRKRRGVPRLGDHVFRTRGAVEIRSWAVAPEHVPPDAVFGPSEVAGLDAEGGHGRFVRAMASAQPNRELREMVEKASLLRDDELVRISTDLTGARPVLDPGVAPVSRAAGGGITIVTAMKNEGPFILDWIAHHRAIGVERFLVYTNDCADPTARLLDALAPAGVTRRDNPYRTGVHTPQHAAFRDAARRPETREAEWLLTLDIDEYVNIRAGEGRLDDLFEAADGANVISMPWRLFGNADRHRFEDDPVTDQFTLAAPEWMPRPYQAWGFKTLYRNDGLFRHLGVHRPKGLTAEAGRIHWVGGDGRPLPPRLWRNAWRMGAATAGYDLVQVNHYAVRSAESFLVKRDRGRVNHVDRDQGLNYWFRMNHNVEKEQSISRLASRVAVEKVALLALPRVAALHAEAVEWHRARARALRETSAHRALWAEITSERMETLSRLTPRFGTKIYEAGPSILTEEALAALLARPGVVMDVKGTTARQGRSMAKP